jgi:hypothetical protein
MTQMTLLTIVGNCLGMVRGRRRVSMGAKRVETAGGGGDMQEKKIPGGINSLCTMPHSAQAKPPARSPGVKMSRRNKPRLDRDSGWLCAEKPDIAALTIAKVDPSRGGAAAAAGGQTTSPTTAYIVCLARHQGRFRERQASLIPARPSQRISSCKTAYKMAYNLLPGKVVVVTGCSTGIGRAIAIGRSHPPVLRQV